MPDRPCVSLAKILSAARQRAGTGAAAEEGQVRADRALAAALRRAVWILEGREGPAPGCEADLEPLAAALALASPDELVERRQALAREGLAVSAAVCWELAMVAEARIVH